MEPVIYVCTAEAIYWSIRRWKCPNCGKRRMLVETFEWYDALVSCLKCGDQWSGGERLERPFARGWRERSVDQLESHLSHHLTRKEI